VERRETTWCEARGGVRRGRGAPGGEKGDDLVRGARWGEERSRSTWWREGRRLGARREVG